MATNTAIVNPEQVGKLISPLVNQVQQLKIQTNDDYEMGCSLLQVIATRKKQVEEVFDPIVSKAYAAHKEAVGQKKKFMDPLLAAEFAVKGKVSQYQAEQERIRRKEEDRQREFLKAENEKRAIEEASQLTAEGEQELADIVLQNAIEETPVVVVSSSVPKQEGISSRKDWNFRITNEMLIPREYLMVNEKAIRAVVKAQKSLTKIPGVEVFSRDTVSVRV
jgi:hypothetical protein